MKPAKDKIEAMEYEEDFESSNLTHGDAMVNKLNELVDKVNKLSHQMALQIEINKLESQPEEQKKKCKHRYEFLEREDYFRCALCKELNHRPEKYKELRKSVYGSQPEEPCKQCKRFYGVDVSGKQTLTIYACEEHAISKDPSPKKECSCTCAQRPHAEECQLNHCSHKQVIYTSEGDAVGEVGGKE